MYDQKNIFILGMARSGYEVAKVLLKRGNKVLITDAKDQIEEHVKQLQEMGANVVITNEPESLLTDKFDVVVKNPGINSLHKCVVKAKKLNIDVVNEMEVAFNLLPPNVTVIGITGSNGKTTTTTIAYQFLKRAGINAHIGGNIGIPFSAMLKDIQENDVVVLEVSVQQLFDLNKFHPNIGLITNLTGAHLDICKTLENYINLKLKMFANFEQEDIAIINVDDKEIVDVDCNKNYFSSKYDADIFVKDRAIYYNDEQIIKLHDIRIKGNHNYENIMGAIIIAKQFKVENNVIKEVLNNFSGVAHRLEFVSKLNDREFYNDSKSTNVTSTQVALSSFDKPTILLLGGLDRGHSFDELKDYMDDVKSIVAFGETKARIKEFGNSIGIDTITVDTIADAVKVSYNLSEPGDVIILSPACASWDQYPDFEVRGNDFKNQVEKLMEVN